VNENPNSNDVNEGEAPPAGGGPAPGPNDPPRLTRPESGRLILGVAEGLARYFRVDPVFIRIGFIIATFFGGIGLIAYLGLALFTPTGDSANAINLRAPYQEHPWLGAAGGALLVIALIPAFHGGFWNFSFAIGGPLLLVAGAAVLFIALRNRRVDGDGPPPPGTPVAGPTAPRERETTPSTTAPTAAAQAPTATTTANPATGDTAVLRADETTNVAPVTGSQPRRGTGTRVLAAFGIAILAFGAFMTAGAFAAFGDAATTAIVVAALGVVLIVAGFLGGIRWVAMPVLSAALAVSLVVASDFDLSGGVGDVERRPHTAAAIPDEGYKLGVGRLAIDLRRFDWEETPVLPLRVEAGIGKIAVVVPADVCVDAYLRTEAGQLTAGGEQIDGMNVESQTTAGDGTPRLELDAELKLGEIIVVASDRDNAMSEAMWGGTNLREQTKINRDACQGAS